MKRKLDHQKNRLMNIDKSCNQPLPFTMISSITTILTELNYSWLCAKKQYSSEFIIFFWDDDAADAPTFACWSNGEIPYLQISCLTFIEAAEKTAYFLMFSVRLGKRQFSEKAVIDHVRMVRKSIKPDEHVKLGNHTTDIEGYLELFGYKIIELKLKTNQIK